MDVAERHQLFVKDSQPWLRSEHGGDMCRTVTLDISTFVEDTHYPNGLLLSGTPIAEITASGLYGPYDDDAADGRETFAGFTFATVRASGDNNVHVALLEHGHVREDKLPIAVDVAAKAEVAGRMWFS